MITQEILTNTIKALVTKYGKRFARDIEEGVKNVGKLWISEDGDDSEFYNFCTSHYVPKGEERDVYLKKCDNMLEIWQGRLGEIATEFSKGQILDLGPLTPFDTLLARHNPYAHTNDDMFESKIAFFFQLNFKRAEYSKENAKETWKRAEWVTCRLSEIGEERIPAEISKKCWDISKTSENYIDNYYIHLNNVIYNGQDLFENYKPLSVHWGLRDEIRALYTRNNEDKKNIERQRAIFNILESVIIGNIPKEVINENNYKWDLNKNSIHKKADSLQEKISPEETERYEFMNKHLQINLELDKYSNYKSILSRSFMKEKEIPKDDIKNLLKEILAYPDLKRLSKFLEKKLNRKLEPFDIWFKDFHSVCVPEEQKDEAVHKYFKNIDVFQAKIPKILTSLGFSKTKAEDIASRIIVENSRGSGHAAGPPARWDIARLRTHAPDRNLNWKSFFIAMHELGHNVEQVISSCFIDWYVMAGVPNTAFTEGFAFVFADRANEMIKSESLDCDMYAFDRYFQAYEMSGIALTEIEIWEWLYDHPHVSVEELKQTVIYIANDVWKKYFAKYFGENKNGILSIYSHNILDPLYIPNYVVGYVIAYQIHNYLKDKKLGKEMERMCLLGRLTPQEWMKKAIGEKISALPLLNDVTGVLNKLKY